MTDEAFHLFIANLKTELKKELPGTKSQYKMAPQLRIQSEPTDETTEAGVLILLFPRNNKIETVFIRRHKYNGVHSGQISLPGGKFESKDKNIINTALRETEEEIGVNKNTVNVIGTLTPLYISVSDIIVSPVIGYTDTYPVFSVNKSEVNYIINSEINSLINVDNKTTEIIKVKNSEIKAPLYKIAPTDKIWGATAMILSEFIDLITRYY